MIYLYLAQGFEEIEALATVDILRRCEFDVVTVGVGSQDITGAHDITVLADTVDNMAAPTDDVQAVVLPGGMPGTLNEEKSEYVQKMIDFCVQNDKLVCAICAAPSILGHKGLLNGKRATCFPGFEQELVGAEYSGNQAEKDGNIITGKGAGAVFDFAFEIASALGKGAKAKKVKESMQCAK